MSQEFQRLPDGSLIMRRPKSVEKPGFLAGLLQRFMPQKPQEAPYWMPSPEAVQAREVAPATQQGAPASLPAYNGTQAAQWAELEDQAAKEAAIAEQLKGVSRRVMESPALIEGKWLGGR